MLKAKSSIMRFGVVIERDEDGYYVATVPSLPGSHTQARSLDELIERIREAMELYLEVEKDIEVGEFIGCKWLKLRPVKAEMVIRVLNKLSFQKMR